MLTKTDKIDALWNGLTFAIVSILGFINFSFNYRSFSNSEFGLFILINSVFGIGYSLDFGFGVSTVKHISEARKNSDSRLVNSIFISFLVFFLLIALILVIVYILYYKLFFSKTDLFVTNDQSKINVIYTLLTLSFFFKYISNFMNKIYEGYAEFILVSKINLTIAFTYFLTVLSIFIFKLSIVYLALFLFINSFLTFSTLFTISLIKLPELKFKMSFFDLKLLKKYAAYSINLQLSFLLSSFVDPVIKFLTGNFISLSFVTYFETAKKIIDLSNGLIFSAQKGLLNKLSENNAVGKLKDFINDEIFVYSKMSNYYSILLYGILNPLIFFFVLFWFKNIESSVIMLIFFAPYSLINFGGCLYLVFMIEGKGVKLFIIQFINLLFVFSFLYLSLLLTKSFIGLIGFYFATILSIIIIFFIFSKYYGFNVKAYLSRVKMNKLILLNIVLIIEIAFMIYYESQLNYILSGYFIINCLLFYNEIFFFYKLIRDRTKPLLNKLHWIKR
jgi:O-antigen/teichoic acid export membrane protein